MFPEAAQGGFELGQINAATAMTERLGQQLVFARRRESLEMVEARIQVLNQSSPQTP